jgi:hypothetical protein
MKLRVQRTQDLKTVATFQIPGTLSSLDEKYQCLHCTPQMKMRGFMGPTLPQRWSAQIIQ